MICTLDAAGADHFGCSGYPRPATPNIDRLADTSPVFGRHWRQATLADLSTASLFSAQYPETHLPYGARPMDDGICTLARGLRDAGCRTELSTVNPYALTRTT